MKNTFYLMLTLMMASLFILSGCANTKEVKTVADYQKTGIVIGLDDSFVPMGFRDETGELVGFDVALSQAVASELGMDVTFQAIDWSMKETELANKTIDMIWNGYTVTKEREEKVAFSQPYLKNKQVVVTMKKNHITDLDKLTNQTLGVQEGSSGEEAFNQSPDILKNKVKNKEAISYPAYTEAFMDLEAGRIEGVLIDKIFADYYLSQKENKADFQLVATQFPEESYAIGFRKEDQALIEAVNQALTTVSNNGSAEKISQKWFGDDRLIK